MRFKNNTKFILSIGGRDALQPFGISREFAPKEIEANDELQSRLLAKHISEYTGVVPEAPTQAEPDIRYERDPQLVQGKLVTDTTTGKKPVQYVVADAEGSDGVSMDAEGQVTSFGKDIHQSADFIEEGVDAGAFKNGADAMESELNKETTDATFDDEDTLSENESERSSIPDADEAIAADASQFVQQRGKMGAETTTARAMIEKSVTSEMNKVNKEIVAGSDDVQNVNSSNGKVVEFMKQPLNAKKFMIAKETDSGFLKEVNTISQSETIKSLVTQRLEELK